MISKPLKGLPKRVALSIREESSTLLNRIIERVDYGFKMYLYYPVESFFRRIHERASRSLAFAIHGWMHYDFESAYIYDLMAFKMKRIHECLKNGHAIQSKEDMSALKEAIAICERLFEGQYDAKYYKIHEKKWGKLSHKSKPHSYDKNGKVKTYSSLFSRSKAKTDSEKKKEVADLRKIWVLEEKDRVADLDRLNEILKKHEPCWWD